MNPAEPTPSDSDAASAAALRRVSRMLSVGLILLGGLVLTGWLFGIAALKSMYSGSVSMKANTALLFVVMGVALRSASAGGSPRVRQLSSAFVLAGGLVTGMQYLLQVDFGIDQLLFRDASLGLSAPGRMSPETACGFILLGLSLLLLDARSRPRPSDVFGLAVAAGAFLALCGYCFGARGLYQIGSYVSMAVHTALGMLAASVALLTARPGEGVSALLVSDTTAGRLLTRMLPAIVLVPLGVGWLQVRGQALGLYDAAFGTALQTAIGSGLLAVLVWVVGGSLHVAEMRAARAVAEVANREQQLAVTLRSIGDAVIATDAGGLIVRMNPAAEQLTGWTERQAVQRPLREVFNIVNEATGAEVACPVERVLRDGKVVGLANHTLLIARDGQRHPIANSGAPIHPSDDAPIEGVVLVFRDVSSERAVERAQHELTIQQVAADRLRERAQLFELSLDLVCIIDAAGRLLQFNPALIRTLGYDAEALRGVRLLGFVHPDDRGETERIFARIAAGGAARTDFTNRVRQASGDYRWLQWRAAPAPDGTYYAVARDVTDDRELLEQLRSSEERHRLIADGVRGYAIYMLDPEGRVASWTPGAQSLKGYAPSEIIGQHFSVFYTPEDRKRDRPASVLREAERNGRLEEEGWRVTKAGSRFWASVVLTALRSEDETLRGFAKVTRDLTERHRADEMLRASLHERDVLLQEVHHRVKNNLQVISSLIKIQARKVSDESARTALAECRARIEAIALIHEKLYRTRSHTTVRFDDYVRSLTKNVFRATRVSESNVRLHVDIAKMELSLDKAIPCGLILNELMTNALKHAFPGDRHGAVQVTLKQHDGEAELVVADDGIGLPRDFETAKAPTLGMQLVATLAAQLDGRLEIGRDSGTALRLTFPSEPPPPLA